MTKRDYVEIARILKGIKVWCRTHREETMHKAITDRVATYCGDHNPAFLRSKFKEAAGVE